MQTRKRKENVLQLYGKHKKQDVGCDPLSKASVTIQLLTLLKIQTFIMSNPQQNVTRKKRRGKKLIKDM